MTTPSTPGKPADVWRELYVSAGTASPSVRACVSAAFRIADQVWRQVITDPGLDSNTRRRVVGDDNWAKTALAAYHHLSADGAYAHLDVPAQLRCWADPQILTLWLTGPSPLPGFSSVSVAETWGITDDTFHWEADEVAATMGTLVDQAQKVGHYGVPGYTISLRHVTSDDPHGHASPIIEHQVTVRTPSGALLATEPIATDHLTDDDLSGVDAAIAVLTNTASYVNELLADEARIVTSVHDSVGDHASQPQPGRTNRGFTPLDLTAAASLPAAIESSTPPQADRRPHR
jgi:hypothetical protein